MGKTALITGITGQDGSYLSELLLSKGYEVHGLIRRASTFNTVRLEHLYRDPHDPEARHAFDVTGLEQRIDEIQNQQRLHTVLGEALPRFSHGDKAERARMAEETGRAAGTRQLQCLTAAAGNISAGGHGTGGTRG